MHSVAPIVQYDATTGYLANHPLIKIIPEIISPHEGTKLEVER